MADTPQVSQQVTKSESAENKRSTPKIFMVMLAVGAVAIIAVLAIGSRFIFH